MSTATTTVTDAFRDLLSKLQSGEILDAFGQHYAPNVEMTEGTGQTTSGFEANLEREKQFLASVKEWKSLTVQATAINDEGNGNGATFIEYSFDFINTDEQPVHYEQVARQTWSGGKIISERFYYNAG
ncbi:MAG: nuclear transport factor 2 family protein [Planctomycetota bacterium]